MAKHCTNCGHELRDTDKFCAECGTAVGGVAPESQPTQWEYCEIGWKLNKATGWFSDALFFYRADAAGPRGTYVAGESPLVTGKFDWAASTDADPNDKAAYEALVRQLTSDGWVIVGKGNNWFSYKFRRPVKG